MSEQYWKDRADALERALRSYRTAALGFAEAVREDTQTAYPWHPLDEAEKKACAVLDQQEPDQPGRAESTWASAEDFDHIAADQPAQDGGRLDPYTLEWIARDCERRAEELCEAARENRQGCARGSYRDQEANHLENEAHSLMKRAEYYRNLQPDQPADAGETVSVPREPTAKMLQAGNQNIHGQINDPEWPTNPPYASAIYRAMIVAAIRRTENTGGGDE